MTTSTVKLPLSVKFGISLLSILILGYMLHNGKDIAVPLLFSGLLAILLMRPVEYLEGRKWCPRPLAIIIPVLAALLLLAGVTYFFYTQFSVFAQDMPMLKERLAHHVTVGQHWIQQYFNIAISDQDKYIDDTIERVKSSGVIGKTFLSIGAALSLVILIPVFTYLLLYYRKQIINFFTESFKHRTEGNIKQMFHQAHVVVESYLGGLMIEMAVVIVLNIIGLSLIGIKYALLLAILAGVLNLIPYLGMISAAAFAMLLTVITSGNPLDAVWVMVTLGCIQLVDNYFILPMVVGSKVQINALATILAVLIGGTVMGVPGMFLSIPMIAVTKVICERIDHLKPWAALLDTNGEKKNRQQWNFMKLFRKKTTLRAVHKKADAA